jgi:hypothetical protein
MGGGLYSGSTSSSVLVVIASPSQAGLWFDQGAAVAPAAPLHLLLLQQEQQHQGGKGRDSGRRATSDVRRAAWRHGGIPDTRYLICIRTLRTTYHAPAPAPADRDKRLHPELGSKKHGNGIHPPNCFLFKCISQVRPINAMASFLALSLFD